jgi:hypothetical protein
MIGPEIDDLTGKFRAIVAKHRVGSSMQINQPVQHPDHIFSAKARADLNGKRFPCEYIHDC